MEKHKIIIIAVAVLLVVLTLFVPPFFGRNDDGSIAKHIYENGLVYQDAAKLDSLNAKFDINPQRAGTFMPIIAAKTVNSIFSRDVFDIRMMSLIYLPVFLIGLYLIISSINTVNKKVQICVCILAAIVLCDVSYISFYNSFYYDALYLSALTLLFGSLMVMCTKEGISILALVFSLLAVTMIASAGAFGATIAILTAILFFALGFGDKSQLRRPFTVATSLLMVVISLGVLSIAPSIKGGDLDRYNALFCGVLEDSEDIKGDLEYFGIPEKYASFAGRPYEEVSKEVNFESGIVKEELFSKIRSLKIVSFYVSHPARLYKVFNKAAKCTPALSKEYIATETDKGFLKTAPALWSTVRRFLMPGSLWVLAALFIILIVIAVLGMKKKPFFSKILLFSVAAAAVLLAEPVISGGLASISRRLVLFQFAVDMTLLMLLIRLINAAPGHGAKQDKFKRGEI